MGNLEKAGVLVVVALLAVILVVAFLNFPDTGKAPVLGANAGKMAQAPDVKKANPKPEPTNIYPRDAESDLIKPRTDDDRLATDPPPRLPDAPVVIGAMGSTPNPPANREPAVRSNETIVPKPETSIDEEKKPPVPPAAASPWPKHVKVQSGESLWAIAVREYGSKVGPRMVGAIADANPSVRPEALKAGVEISLPAPPGETATKPPETAAKTAPAGGTGKTSGSKTPPASSKPARKLPFVPE